MQFPQDILTIICDFCGNGNKKKIIIHLNKWINEYIQNLLYLSFYNNFNVLGGIEFRFKNYYFSQKDLRIDSL